MEMQTEFNKLVRVSNPNPFRDCLQEEHAGKNRQLHPASKVRQTATDVWYFGFKHLKTNRAAMSPYVSISRQDPPSNIHPIDAAIALLSTGEIKQLNSIHKGTPRLLPRHQWEKTMGY